jgi:(p)ppGpp synthase/HD superfamily hydrolase
MSMPTIEETIAFIRQAHAGQKDKSGRDYFHHPVAVMNRLPADVDEEVRLAALLHDVIEDTGYTREQLAAMGYSQRTLDAVELVTLKEGDARPYAEKVQAIIASGNRDAIQVKYADVSENSDPARLALLPAERREVFLMKYTAPLAALRAALEPLDSAVPN